ncbi:phytoene/squalene synthase family protein [Halapricum hydrolyticum]|uniref:Squalene/phytoene synthase family protein n=1 Tax=Halapricum hydrolyticum TaxID=2979991 RepID=A0AAE3ICF7_9EURY|nr:phytoene/squalene synthase family protein [Halapricum hydrolyticum]MCU4717999.1 squalene/phytoene synthase family protein [Halapricum hydrolyticum]MCU4727164.1 squalene/phytoene synthase family protein [Halapricum hydrolyticum]
MADTSETADAATIERDLAWSHEIVQDVSRTFAITIDVLEEPMASSICVGYLLCRVPDTIEDAGHIPPEQKAALLETYDSVLDPADTTTVEAFENDVAAWVPDDGGADWELVAQTDRVLRVFESRPERIREAIRPPARELVGGMATFVRRYASEGGLRLQARQELHEYCHYAAGTVGELVTNLVCGEETPSGTCEPLEENAEAFGLALQLVNIAKDVGADFHEEDNVYLPADELEAEDVDQGALDDPDSVDGVVTVVRRTIEDARDYLDDAQTWLEHVPERAGNRTAAWAIPYLLAVGTLREIESRPEDVLRPEGVKISRQEVGAVIEACLGGLDAETLGGLRRQIADEPLSQDL